MIAQRRTCTHTHTHTPSHTKCQRSQCDTCRTWAISALFNYTFPSLWVSMCCIIRDGDVRREQCVSTIHIAFAVVNNVNVPGYSVSWCINKSLQSTISIYYSGRKYLKPLCEHDWFGMYALGSVHTHPLFASCGIFASSDHQCNRHTRIHCAR